MDILNPTDKTVDALMKLELPAGVDVQIELNRGPFPRDGERWLDAAGGSRYKERTPRPF